MRVIIIVTGILFIGCASGYKSIAPRAVYYQAKSEKSGLELSYRMGVLTEHRNKKYAKREQRSAIHVVCVKLANNTGRDLVVGQDFRFYSGDSELVLLDPQLVHQELKQPVPIYLLYLLLSPLQIYTTDEYGNTDTYPIGLFLGPGIAAGNMLGAGSANQNFLRELLMYNMINKTVPSGETVYGLISVRDNGYNPIHIEMN